MRAFPLLAVLLLAVALPLAAAPVPKDFTEAVEEFDWKGDKRKRTVRTLDLGGEKVEFVKVPKGDFRMGSDREADRMATIDETPRHKVTFTKPLWVGKHPVTKGQFAVFVKATGHKTDAEADGKGGWGYDGDREFFRDPKFSWRETAWEQTDRHPVVNVTWNDATAYAAWAAKANRQSVRLLNETEHEYAVRGGETTRFLSGDDPTDIRGYANVADESAKEKWGCSFGTAFDDDAPFTSPVGKYKPNGYGLYDTTGNVWCWCADWFDPKLYTRRKDGVTNPPAADSGPRKERAIRGGSWVTNADGSRPAHRTWNAPDARHHSVGFRVCFDSD